MTAYAPIVHWWKKGVIYQIYPRSYKDSNNDGIGDLRGIIDRLDYIKDLGVQAIWLSPIYPSPMADFGYDISDFKGIDPVFGSMQDFEELLGKVHDRGMKLMLDLVPNHTSVEHPWFVESRSSRDNPKRDWYLWHDGKPDGSIPNNWLAAFGGSAWEWDEATGQYYYHAFLKEQPDLNWRNPEVQQAMFEVMRFWLNKGVDGFRIDVMWHLIKDKLLRDNPANLQYNNDMAEYDSLMPIYTTDRPEVYEVVAMLRSVLDEYPDRMMIGEVYLAVQQLIPYYGANNNGAHLPMNSILLLLPWEAKSIATAIDEYEGALPDGAWPNWVLGNHDQHRIASRVGKEQIRVAAMLLLTLRGTPIVYYGEEIGMCDAALPKEELKDPQGRIDPSKSKDLSRTPMQWDNSDHAGFSNVTPWIRLHKNYTTTNVTLQGEKPDSTLSFYKRLLGLRNQEPSLSIGNYKTVLASQQMLCYVRELEGAASFLILLNLTHMPSYFDNDLYKGTVVFATEAELEGQQFLGSIALGGDEGVIIKLTL